MKKNVDFSKGVRGRYAGEKFEVIGDESLSDDVEAMQAVNKDKEDSKFVKNKVTKIRKKRDTPRVRKVVSGQSSASAKLRRIVIKENRQNFENFMRSKGCQIFTEFIKLEVMESAIFGVFPLLEFPIKRFVCPTGMLKDFEIYFRKNLEFKEDYKTEIDFTMFILNHLGIQQVPKDSADKALNRIKGHKGGKRIKKHIQYCFDRRAQDTSIKPKALAIEIIEKRKKAIIQKRIKAGMSESDAIAKKMPEKVGNDHNYFDVEKMRISINKAFNHHKNKKTIQKANEKLFQQSDYYLSVFRTGNDCFIITSDGEKTAES